jgi:2,4-diaminopentanoate dehydrogenase
VVVWGTGNVGRHALIGIEDRPDLELVGVWVSSEAKVGRDAGELAGLDHRLGVAATGDVDDILALRPDCVIHTAMADDRLTEAVDDLCRLLRAGINVISSGPVFLQFPDQVAPDMAAAVRAAAAEGGVSLWVNGLDPGFGNDWLPLSMTAVSERIEEIRCLEILNYNTYDQGMVLFDIMGFGRPLGSKAMLLLPGVLTMAWGSVIHQIAAGLDVEIDDVEEWFEQVPAPEAFDIASGRIEAGTAAGLHFEVRGLRNGRPVIVVEHVTRLRDDLAPDWPQPAGQGCYRVEVRVEPNYTVDMQLLGRDGDHNTAGLKATAMRLVNAVPAVVDAGPGLLSVLDLPLVTGRGLVV